MKGINFSRGFYISKFYRDFMLEVLSGSCLWQKNRKNAAAILAHVF